MPSIGSCAQLACILEATARKPGNVHRYADFADTTYLDFLLSAAAIAPVLDSAAGRPVGQTVLQAIQATRGVVRRNTNLGIVLLLAPLAAVPPDQNLVSGTGRVLDALDMKDARAVYEAVRLVRPGGLGEVPEQDIRHEPSVTLREAMALAADRDMIARQYVTGFAEVFDEGVPALQAGLTFFRRLETAIIWCHLFWLAQYPDSLIVRKRGDCEADEVQRRAFDVIAAGWPGSAAGRQQLAAFDAWLRADGNARNPGTSADLVTACLFVALRQGLISVPLPMPW